MEHDARVSRATEAVNAAVVSTSGEEEAAFQLLEAWDPNFKR